MSNSNQSSLKKTKLNNESSKKQSEKLFGQSSLITYFKKPTADKISDHSNNQELHAEATSSTHRPKIKRKFSDFQEENSLDEILLQVPEDQYETLRKTIDCNGKAEKEESKEFERKFNDEIDLILESKTHSRQKENQKSSEVLAIKNEKKNQNNNIAEGEVEVDNKEGNKQSDNQENELGDNTEHKKDHLSQESLIKSDKRFKSGTNHF